MVQMITQAAVDIAQQTQSVSQGGISPDGWKVISFLCAAIGAMFLWIKALIAKVDSVQDARIQDLKDNAALVREDIRKDD